LLNRHVSTRNRACTMFFVHSDRNTAGTTLDVQWWHSVDIVNALGSVD
jgi:hypothetical protein